MKRHGSSYIKTGHIPSKADAEKQQQWIKTTLYPAIKEARSGIFTANNFEHCF
jgi:hypothetical protein